MKKEKKPRATKTAPVKARPEGDSPVPDAEPLPSSEGSVVPDGGEDLSGTSVPVFPSETGRKRARFARKEKAEEPARRLPMDEESVAIRNLADAGLLASSELKKHADKLQPHLPQVEGRLKDWRASRET